MRGGTDAQADDLIASVSPALVRRRRTPALVVQVADDLPATAVHAVLAALPARTPRLDWAGRASLPAPAGARVLLLAAHRVDPRRAVELVRHDVVHLPLVLSGSAATVGPIVAPGRTACLNCLDARRRREDPSWPLIAAQLLARPKPAIDVAFAAEAARAARHLVSDRIDPLTRSLHLRADSLQRAWHTHLPSEDCCCRSLEGNATASAPIDLGPATNSPTVFARPA
jgi:bacteriocin biosynthesis cyclodehydratase domain-containing protein